MPYDPIAGIRGGLAGEPLDQQILQATRDARAAERRSALPTATGPDPAAPVPQAPRMRYAPGFTPNSDAGAGASRMPTLDELDEIKPAPPHLQPHFFTAEELTGVPALLLEGMGYNESRWRQDIIDGRTRSSAGGTGVMQFTPIGIKQVEQLTGSTFDPLDPEQAIPAAGTMMRYLYGQFDGNWTAAVAAYNWGEGNVRKAQRKHGDDWLDHAPRETREYVGRLTPVLASLDPTPSATLASTDPTVFLRDYAAHQEVEPERMGAGARLLDFTPSGRGEAAGATLLFDPKKGKQALPVGAGGATGPFSSYFVPDEDAEIELMLGGHKAGGYMTLFGIGGKQLFRSVVGTVNMLGRSVGLDIGQDSLDALAEDIVEMERTLPMQMLERRAAKWAQLGSGSVWSDPAAILVQLVENLPNFAATLGTGGAIGIAGRILKWAPKLTTALAGATGAATEGTIVSGAVYNDLVDGIRETPDEGLMATPRYKELRDSGMSEEQAKQALIDELGPAHALTAGGVSAVFGGVASGWLGRLIGAGRQARKMRAPKDVRAAIVARTAPGAARRQALRDARVMGTPGRLATAGRGALVEAGTESIQEGQETIAGNLAAQKSYDPTRGTFEGVPESMVAGAGLGAIMGAGPAAASPAGPIPANTPAPPPPQTQQQLPGPTGPQLPPNYDQPPGARRQGPMPAGPTGAPSGPDIPADIDRPTVARRGAAAAQATGEPIPPEQAGQAAAGVTGEAAATRPRLEKKAVKSALAKLNPVKTTNNVARAVRGLVKRVQEIYPDLALPKADRQRSADKLADLLVALDEAVGETYPELVEDINQILQTSDPGTAVRELEALGDRIYAAKVRADAGVTGTGGTVGEQLTQALAQYDAEVENLRRGRGRGQKASSAKRPPAGKRAIAMESLATAVEAALNAAGDIPGVEPIRQVIREARAAAEAVMKAGKKATGNTQTESTPTNASHKRQDVREQVLRKAAAELQKILNGEPGDLEGLREEAEAALTRNIVASIKKRREEKAAEDAKTPEQKEAEAKAKAEEEEKAKDEKASKALEKARAKAAAAKAKREQEKAEREEKARQRKEERERKQKQKVEDALKKGEERQAAGEEVGRKKTSSAKVTTAEEKAAEVAAKRGERKAVIETIRQQFADAKAFIAHASKRPIEEVRGLARTLGAKIVGTRAQIAKRVADIVWPTVTPPGGNDTATKEVPGRKPDMVVKPNKIPGRKVATMLRDAGFDEDMDTAAIREQVFPNFNKDDWALVRGFVAMLTDAQRREFGGVWQAVVEAETTGELNNAWLRMAAWMEDIDGLRVPDNVQTLVRDFADQLRVFTKARLADTAPDSGLGADVAPEDVADGFQPEGEQAGETITELPAHLEAAIDAMQVPEEEKNKLRQLALEQMQDDLAELGYATQELDPNAEGDLNDYERQQVGYEEATMGPAIVDIQETPATRQPPYSWYYSALYSSLFNAKMSKGTPQQWLNYLRKRPGVTADELHWSGLEERLAELDPNKAIDKAAAMLLLHGNEVTVDTLVYQDPPPEWFEALDKLEAFRELLVKIAGFNVYEQAHSPDHEKFYLTNHYYGDNDAVTFDINDIGTDAFTRKIRLAFASGMAAHQRASKRLSQEAFSNYVIAVSDAVNTILKQAAPVLQRFYELQTNALNETETKYRGHTEDGGSNYKEVLLRLGSHGRPKNKLPPGLIEYHYDKYGQKYARIHIGRFVSPDMSNDLLEQAGKRIGSPFDNYVYDHKTGRLKYVDIRLGEGDYPMERIELLAGLEANIFPRDYRGPHFEPDNVLLHIRTKDRTTSDGRKVLFIEEIQSDWHQDIVGNRTRFGFPVSDAPFAKTWQNLAMKRVMHQALEGGYDIVAWTTGGMQYRRSIGKHMTDRDVRKITYTYVPEFDEYQIDFFFEGSSTPFPVALSARQLRHTLGEKLARDMELKKGKQLDKHTRMVVYASGMRPRITPDTKKGKFHTYDKLVPSAAEKLAKPYGAAVTQFDVGLDEKVSGVELTPEMRNSLAQTGLALFGAGPTYADIHADPAQRQVSDSIKEIVEGLNRTSFMFRVQQQLDMFRSKFPSGTMDFRSPAFVLAQQSRDLNVPLDSLLKEIANAGSENNPLRRLALKLLSLNLGTNVIFADQLTYTVNGKTSNPSGSYVADFERGPSADSWFIKPSNQAHIFIAGNTDPSKLVHYILHEAVHAATMTAWRTDEAFRSKIQKLYDHARYAAHNMGIDTNTVYGFKAPYEMIAEAFTAPEFQAILMRIEAPGGKVSLFTRFLQAIVDFFGLSKENTSYTMLAEVATLAENSGFWSGDLQASVAATVPMRVNNEAGTYTNIEEVAKASSPGVAQAVMQALRPKSTWEGFKERLRDGWLWFHTLTQVENRYSRFFDTSDGNNLKSYIASMRKKRSIAHKEHAAAEKVNSLWRQLSSAEDLAVSQTMQDATLWEIDPTLTWDEHVWLQSRKLKDEQRNKEAYEKVMAQYEALSPEAKKVFAEVTKYFKKQRHLIREAFIDNVIEKYQIPLKWREFLLQLNTIEDVENFIGTSKKLNKKRISSFWYQVGEEYRERFQQDVGDNIGRIAKDMSQILSASSVNGTYVPLRRYGEYVITVGEEANSEFATREEAEDFAREVQLRSPANRIVAIRTLNDGRWTVDYTLHHIEFDADYGRAQERVKELEGMGYKEVMISRKQDARYQKMADVSPLFAELLRKFKDTPELEGQLRNAFTELLASNAMRAAMLRRKGYAGAKPKEMRQAFAERAFAGGWYLADLLSAEERRDTMMKLRESATDSTVSETVRLNRGRVVKEVARREQMDLKDRESSIVSDAIAKTGFLWFLFSPSYSLINATQVAMYTLPYLGGKFGMGNATREIGRAYKEVLGPFMKGVKETKAGLDVSRTADVFIDYIKKVYKNDPALRKLLREVEDRGLLEVTFMQEIADTARGIEGTTFEKTVQIARTLPQGVEVLNRVVTAVATYRLAIAKGMTPEQATELAFDANDQTQLDYSMQNRPPAFKFPGGRAVMLFKMFGQGVYNLIISNIYDAFTGSVRDKKEARRILGGLAVTHTMAAGVLGGIFIEPLRWVINGIAYALGDDDEPFDLDYEVREFLVNGMGLPKGVAQVAAEGLPNIFNMNLHSRIGAHQLLFMGNFDLSTDATTLRTIAMLVGPAASMGLAPIDASRRIAEGDIYGGLRMMLPAKVLRDLMTSYDMGMNGLSDRRGVGFASADEFGFGSMAMQAFGIMPTTRTEIMGARRQATAYERYKTQRKRRLAARWHNADTPAERMRIWREEIMPFNRTVPAGERIKMPSLYRTRRQRSAEERAATQRGELGGGTLGAGRLEVYDVN